MFAVEVGDVENGDGGTSEGLRLRLLFGLCFGRNKSSRDSTCDIMVAIRSASSTPISLRSNTSAISLLAMVFTSEPVAEQEAL